MTENEIINLAATRLQTFIRNHAPGQCGIISKGVECQCLLCDVSRLAGFALDKRRWRPWTDECCECGCSVEVRTVSDRGAYDGDDVKCPECGQTGYVSADEGGCDIVWHETELPELTEEDRAVMDSFPKDAVSHWCNGEIWDGEKWIPQSLESELNKLMADYAWQKKKQRNIRNAETW